MTDIMNAVTAAQEIATEVSPAPVTFNRVSSASDVKSRLDWGEPAFTLIDIRDRDRFISERIMGAICYSIDTLVQEVGQTLTLDRDIYIYGDSESEAMQAASLLDEAGFKKVAILEGGLAAWKAIGGSTEGRDA